MKDQDEIAISPESATTPTLSFLGSGGLHEFIRYFVASAIAMGLDTGVLWLLTSILGVPYLVSGGLAFLVGLATIYILSVYWVFESRALQNIWVEFLMFSVIGIVGLAINELVLWFFTSVVGLYYLWSKAVSVAIVFTWNFSARRELLFNKTNE